MVGMGSLPPRYPPLLRITSDWERSSQDMKQMTSFLKNNIQLQFDHEFHAQTKEKENFWLVSVAKHFLRHCEEKENKQELVVEATTDFRNTMPSAK